VRWLHRLPQIIYAIRLVLISAVDGDICQAGWQEFPQINRKMRYAHAVLSSREGKNGCFSWCSEARRGNLTVPHELAGYAYPACTAWDTCKLTEKTGCAILSISMRDKIFYLPLARGHGVPAGYFKA
jgi:hypothetical protein